MLSVENILNTLKIKQYNLPKSILLDYDKYEIENESSYLAHIESINYNTVNDVKDEDKVRVKKNFNEMKLIKTYQSIQDILGPCVTTYVHSKSNQSLNYRFLESIFTIIDHSFMMNSYHDKQFIMTQWIKKLDDELVSKEKYYEFNYGKNRKIKRENLLLSINQAYMNKCDYEIFDNFIQYNADMLNITLIVLNMKHGNIDFEESKVFHYKNIFNPLNPLAVLVYDNGVYYPIIRNKESDNSLFNYTSNNIGEEDKAYVTKIYKYMKYNDFDIEKLVKLSKSATIIEEKAEHVQEVKIVENIQEEIKSDEHVQEEIKIDEHVQEEIKTKEEKVKEEDNNKYEKSKLEKLKIDELRNIANIENIPIQKLSEKSGKYINKIKGELIEDILNNTNMFTIFENKEDVKEEDKKSSIEEVEFKYSEKSLEKMKIDMLKVLCVNRNISLTKKSEKTNKDINKLKGELISDLLKSYVL